MSFDLDSMTHKCTKYSVYVNKYRCFVTGPHGTLRGTAIAPLATLIPLVSGTSLVFLALLSGLAARVGGAGVTIGAIRVTFWGALAMAVTAGVGWLFGTVA